MQLLCLLKHDHHSSQQAEIVMHQITLMVISINFKVPILKYCGGTGQIVPPVCLHSSNKIVENAPLLQFVILLIVLKSVYQSKSIKTSTNFSKTEGDLNWVIAFINVSQKYIIKLC